MCLGLIIHGNVVAGGAGDLLAEEIAAPREAARRAEQRHVLGGVLSVHEGCGGAHLAHAPAGGVVERVKRFESLPSRGVAGHHDARRAEVGHVGQREVGVEGVAQADHAAPAVDDLVAVLTHVSDRVPEKLKIEIGNSIVVSFSDSRVLTYGRTR